MSEHKNIADALRILVLLGLPRAQQNKRSALSLLALLDLSPDREWSQAKNPLIGITPIMDWARRHYNKDYAPNTRETVRRKTMHQFVDAGIALYNPDRPDRPVNSPKAVYQIAPDALLLLRTYRGKEWERNLKEFLNKRQTLAERYAREREIKNIPVHIAEGKNISLSPGKHSELIRDIIEKFAPKFIPGGILVYVGDTGQKWGYYDEKIMNELGVIVDSHGKMPDVVIYWKEKDWLVLIESVTSHGPVDGKRHEELTRLFSAAKPGLVFVTAFPDRYAMAKYLSDISWETEVWVADTPTHLIHFNGDRFLGPYS